MTGAFNSTLSWLDSSEHERRAVLELVSALNEPGTLDELGIGSIRDTIADAVFPGTSTIQTPARCRCPAILSVQMESEFVSLSG